MITTFVLFPFSYICWVSLSSSSCCSRLLITCSPTTLLLGESWRHKEERTSKLRFSRVFQGTLSHLMVLRVVPCRTFSVLSTRWFWRRSLLCVMLAMMTFVIFHLLFALSRRRLGRGWGATGCGSVDQLFWIPVGQHAGFLRARKQKTLWFEWM